MQTPGIDVASELLESLPDPVIGRDRDGMIVLWSRAAEEVYGYGAAEAVGRRAAMLLHTRFPAPFLEITEELGDLGHWQGRLEHRSKDGTTVAVESRWMARRDAHGAYVGSFAIDRVLAGEPLPPTSGTPEALGTHTAPAAGASADPATRALTHELNNALAIIINYTSFVSGALAAVEGFPAESARESMRTDLREVQTAAERALELTRRLI